MIYFTIPASSGFVAEDLDVYVDRGFGQDIKLNVLAHEAGATGTSQTGPNGINIRDETASLSIVNVPAATAVIINNYFKSLKTDNLTLVFPEGSVNYYLESWDINIKNLLFANITATLERMYL